MKIAQRAQRYVGPNMGFDFVDGIVVVCMWGQPTDLEWTRYCGFINFYGGALRGVAAYSEKWTPNARQRQEVAESLLRPPQLAMITPSPMVRATLGLLGWIAALREQDGERRLRCFDPEREEHALESHLGLDQVRRIAVSNAKKRIFFEAETARHAVGERGDWGI